MSKLPFLLLAGILSLLASACLTGDVSPVYDVVVVGGGPAGIGAALAAAETGARTALLERDGRIGGTTVQASCMGMGQAAGVTAALAAEKRRDLRDIPIDLIKKRLTDIGHIVPLQ